jgi:sulfite reductase (NADPH) flavoprotein alpha-component
MSTQTAPRIPDDAPFSGEQKAWLNGMFAGLYSTQDVDPAAMGGAAGDGAPAAPATTVTVLYGTQTGNAEGLARRTTDAAKEQGLNAECEGLGSYDVADLADDDYVLIVTSTYGDGDMPDNAALFWDELSSDDAPALDGVQFSVLALGDKSYPDFCAAGKNFDRRLEELGAERVAERVDCDIDYEDPFEEWLDTVMDELTDRIDADASAGAQGDGAMQTPSVSPSGDGAPTADDVEVSESTSSYSKNNPFSATLLENRLLTDGDSNKETRHVEVSLAGSGLDYEVGDAMGVVPSNCPTLVKDLLDALGFRGTEVVPGSDGTEVCLREALLSHYEIGSEVPTDLLDTVAERTGDEELQALLGSEARDEREEFLWGRGVIDFVVEYPVDWDPDEFVELLRPLTPRLYSIASSPELYPNTIHTTVGAVRYNSYGRNRKGVCSTFLADRIQPGANVPIYLQPNNNFGVPEEDERPMIMVGPGTGIAPFRAFLQERRATDADGKNWLFFGEQHEDSDFLYENDLKDMEQEGTLDRLDTAFSRDQDEKVYVQHRMLEHSDRLFGWLEEGAAFYVCGDRTHMAKDVDAALHRIVQDEGDMSEDEAENYVQTLKKEGRYERDVY